MDLAAYLRIQAHANRLANGRLHASMAALSHVELHAPRTSFFPSLIATLNHILMVDQYYILALRGAPVQTTHWDTFVSDDDLHTLAQRQRASDERLIDFCNLQEIKKKQKILSGMRIKNLQELN